ncbi:MAG: efflux RND transporter periplasmic adaptor subunit, partial [Armatimonadetes bacterium]|nr:efflux RND transporter periplasmic adaptor subunit [Armatimonadota bacterium]
SASAGISQAAAAVQAARVMLGYATITAPFDGVVTSRNIDPGSMAAPGMPLVTVEDDSSYRLEATVPESRLAHLHLGAVVDVALDALGVRWPAEIVEITPAADAASHTFIAKAELPDDGRVHSGLFGRMIFPTGEREAILVPDTAIWREASLTGVFVIDNGTAQLRMVQLGASRDGATEVNSGLEDGEIIAADATGLTDGARVSVSGGDAR